MNNYNDYSYKFKNIQNGIGDGIDNEWVVGVDCVDSVDVDSNVLLQNRDRRLQPDSERNTETESHDRIYSMIYIHTHTSTYHHHTPIVSISINQSCLPHII